MFLLSSKVTVAGFKFSGVNEARVKRSLHNPSDSCTIKVPGEGRVKRLNQSATHAEAISELFKEGDKIKVELGYNGKLKTEFEGFVKMIYPGQPLTIECEGYIRQLRLNKSLKGFYKLTSVKELLEIAIKGTDITLAACPDIPLHNITLDNAGGTDIITEIKKLCQGVVTIFFIEPRKLWCGLTYTAYKAGNEPFGIGIAEYRLGYNCKRDNSLKIKTPSEPIQIIFNGSLATGRRISTESEKKVLHNKLTSIVNNLGNLDSLKAIANEMQYQKNYTGFEGSVTGFLVPFAQPGYKVYVRDDRYKDNVGYYMAESTEVVFGMNGGRRIVEIGPLLGFKS